MNAFSAGVQAIQDNIYVHQSRYWHTNSGLLRGTSGFVLVDPAITASDLTEIADFAQPAGVALGLVTHAHWDHLLWSARFGPATPRFTLAAVREQIQSTREDVLVELHDFEVQNCAGEVQWDRDLLFQEVALPSGAQRMAGFNLEVWPIAGHSRAQAAYLFPEEGLLFCADTLSDEEVPTLDSFETGLAEYSRSLERLSTLLGQAGHIIPGHGQAADRHEAERRLALDCNYLEYLSQLRLEQMDSSALEQAAHTMLCDLGEWRADTPAGWQLHWQNITRLAKEQSGS